MTIFRRFQEAIEAEGEIAGALFLFKFLLLSLYTHKLDLIALEL